MEVTTLRQRLVHCLRFSIAWGLVAIPVYAYFAWPNPERLFACLVQYPAATVAYRNLPFPWHEVPHRLTSLSLLTKPSPGNVRTVLSELSPLAIVMLTGAAPLLATLLMTKRTRASLAQCKAWRSCLPFLIACSCGIACYGMMRSSLHHLFPLYTLMLPASLKLLQANFGRSSASVWQPRFMRAGTIGLALTAAAIGGGRWRDAFTRPLVDLPHASGIVSLELKQVDALTTITDTIAAQDPAKTIFVGTNRHDRVHSNPLLIYFLSDTTSGTYFHHFDPGITTELQYQQRIIDDLNASKTLLIVLWRTELPNEPNLSQQSSGVMLLDDFLREKYRTISSTSLFEIRGR